MWIQNEIGTISKNTRNYTRGQIIIAVEWGTSNIGSEIRYPHPGIVLYDGEQDWVIAAPITGATMDGNTPILHEFEVYAAKQNNPPSDPNEFYFKKDCVIQVDQIKRISKHRALNKNSYRIRMYFASEK